MALGASGYMGWFYTMSSSATAYKVTDTGIGQAVCSTLNTGNQALAVFIKSFGTLGIDSDYAMRASGCGGAGI